MQKPESYWDQRRNPQRYPHRRSPNAHVQPDTYCISCVWPRRLRPSTKALDWPIQSTIQPTRCGLWDADDRLVRLSSSGLDAQAAIRLGRQTEAGALGGGAAQPMEAR